MQQPQIDQIIEFTVHDLGISGEGVGKWDGYTVFIDGALPGEVVRGKLFQCNKTYGRARLETVITPSPSRVKPICPIFDQCGGCQIMHMGYSSQLEFKQQRVAKALHHIGKIRDVQVAPCLPSPDSLAYRNKIQLIAAPGQSGMMIGLYARNSHDVVEVEKCYIHCPLGEEVFQAASAIIKQTDITAYDATEGTGLLRHILIKTAIYTKQSLIVLVTNGDITPEIKDAALKMIETIPSVRGVVHNVNRRRDNVILGPEFHTLAGQDHILEDLDGLLCKVSAASFFQVNPAQAIHLYHKAIEFAQLKATETALDLYCGVGTLTLNVAKHVGSAIGVENVAEAIKDAKENAARNKISNVQFRCANAEVFSLGKNEKVDVVFLNPPRKGCDAAVLKAVSRMQPSRIIYISCDPATLARDLGILVELGYAVSAVQPFDMFPQTAHVETVVKLTR